MKVLDTQLMEQFTMLLGGNCFKLNVIATSSSPLVTDHRILSRRKSGSSLRHRRLKNYEWMQTSCVCDRSFFFQRTIFANLNLSRYIIHTVGPIYDEDADNDSAKNGKAELLASCYKTSLELAVKNDLKHIVRNPVNPYASD